MATPLAIVFLGPPGAGKGTQAEAIANRFDAYIHFDLGRAIESILNDPKNQEDPQIRMERERFDAGLLNSPSWIQKIVNEGVRRIAASGKGVILSGCPRTREDTEFLLPLLRDLYGEDSTIIFYMTIPREVSLFRNSHRRVCKNCSTPALWTPENEKHGFCSVCGGELVTRSIDKPEIIEKRFREYEHTTEKIFPLFTALGVPLFEIDGTRSPEEVTNEIAAILSSRAER